MNDKCNKVIMNSPPMMGMVNMTNNPMGMVNNMDMNMNPINQIIPMMNPPMGMMNNMGMTINPLNMINPMMNLPGSKNTTPQNLFVKDGNIWNLIFENNESRVNIAISEQKLIKDAISIYRKKTGNEQECIFIYNNKKLYDELKICQSELRNNSHILVLSLSNLCGATNQN